ncbi:uncharacterized protein [Panulirus ornatus]|uniref:uncharacterized protein isoform X2 n=1 Tax=Panulirus ornatus TaxID=150431 RepID=UPI003A8B2BD8
MAYIFSSGGSAAPRKKCSDCRYEEEQELQEVAWRFMKRREKERKAKEAKEKAKAERERIRAEKKARKALQRSGSNKKSLVFPLLEKDIQMAEGGATDGGNHATTLGPEELKAVR